MLSGLVAFGSNVPELSTAPRALFFAFRHLLVAMDYDKLAATAPFAGPAFYVAYAVLLSLVTIRFVIAVFVDSYAAVMSRAPPRLWVFPPLSSLLTGVKSWFLEWSLNARHAMLVASKRAARAERAASGIDVAHEYDPDIDGAVAPRAAGKARVKQEEEELDAGDAGTVAAKDVGAMYLVMRQRVAKMEERVDERLNQVESMLCATLLPLAKSLDQLVQQNVDQAAARAVKESVASMGGARDAKAVMAAKQMMKSIVKNDAIGRFLEKAPAVPPSLSDQAPTAPGPSTASGAWK